MENILEKVSQDEIGDNIFQPNMKCVATKWLTCWPA